MREKSAMTRKLHRMEQEIKQLQTRNAHLQAQLTQERPTM